MRLILPQDRLYSSCVVYICRNNRSTYDLNKRYCSFCNRLLHALKLTRNISSARRKLKMMLLHVAVLTRTGHSLEGRIMVR